MRPGKSLAVAQYIVEQCRLQGDGSVTPMQLLKLVYVSHGFMLGRHGKPLLNESVEAWQYGPVIPSVYRAIKRFKSSPVTKVDGAPEFDFTETEIGIMNRVVEAYSKIDGVELSRATHQPGTPWRETWDIYGFGAEISNDLIENFYANLLKKPSLSAL